jgi:hypothetical protein
MLILEYYLSHLFFSFVRTNETLSMLKTELQTWRLITSLFIDRVDAERFAEESEDGMILDESVRC